MIEQQQQHADKLGMCRMQNGALHENWGKPQIIAFLRIVHTMQYSMHFV